MAKQLENSQTHVSAFNIITLLVLLVACAALLGCANVTSNTSSEISRHPFGHIPDGTGVDAFTLRNANGVEVQILNYGGIVTSFKVPDKDGKFGDIVLGYDNLEGYLQKSPYFGALVGRYGNRIAKGKFTLDGKEYTLAVNNGPNALHGGLKGFDKVIWNAKVRASPEGPGLELEYTSKDGEEGYPGNLKVTAVYTLTHDNSLKLEYTATTDKDTVVNLTQHSYFNLAGRGDVLNHVVAINTDKFLPVDETMIPTGEIKSVAGTPFDFRKPTAIGARINDDDEQLKLAKGYDHCYVFTKPIGELTKMARITEPTSGRVLEIFSTDPGLQFYTGNHLDGSTIGKGGWKYEPRNAFCMEPQHFPDSPNKPQFPSVVLKPGQVYQHTVEYKFSVGK